MPLVFAAVVPHAPLLVANVAKDHVALLDKTRQQMAMLAGELYAAKPDALIFLTPHGPVVPGCVVLNVADRLVGQLHDFGDMQTEIVCAGASALAHHTKERCERAGIPVTTQTVAQLDYGTTVPLLFFQPETAKLPILPVTMAAAPLAYPFGQVVHELLHERPERVAVIASADFSRRTEGRSIRNARPTAEERLVSSALTHVDPQSLLSLKAQPSTCGVPPVLALLSVLEHFNAHGQVTSFEAPYGVGQITASFSFAP